MNAPVVTIDGPSGAGKGTVGQRLALRLEWHYLDSGALYRVIGHLALDRQCLDDVDALVSLAAGLQIRCEPGQDGVSKIWVNDEDVSYAIRQESVSLAASKVAAIPAVRDALLTRQRAFQRSPGLIADGRDMGSTVFPQADVKIFLTANADARAQRRYKQLNHKGLGGSLSALREAIDERDGRDMSRQASPLIQLADAIVIDTSELTLIESLAEVEKVVLETLKMS